MNVWIFAISAVFSPMLEPLGLDASALEPAPVVEPAQLTEMPMPSDSVLHDMRYTGLERMLAKLESDQP